MYELFPDITNKKLELSDFVEELGPALTHEDHQIRMKATMLLSNVLENLPSDLLTAKQVEFLVTFYCDRMKDHHSMIPAILDGLSSLVDMKNLPQGAASKIVSSLSMNIPCQSQAKDDRAKYFKIIGHLADYKQEELINLGADFLLAVIDAMGGERDPRNLLFLFDFMPQFLRKYPLLHLAEEMFEMFACYFPIDFHPSQNDPEVITREMLAARLEDCLCGTNRFAVHCITLLLEKLESDLSVAKLDSMRLLIRCTEEFHLIDISDHIDDIWKALKLELLSGNEKTEVFQLAINSTKHLVIATQVDATLGEHLLTNIFVAIMGSLAEVTSRLFDHCVKIALACAEASAETGLFVVDKLVPITLSQLHTDELNEQQKCSLIEVIQQIILICKQKSVLHRMSPDTINAVQKELIQILVQEDDSSQIKRIALSTVTSIPELIIDENRFVVYTTIIHVLLSSRDTRLNVEDCLYEFAIQYAAEVTNVIVDKLIAKIYDVVSSSTERIFHALARLLALESMSEKLLEFFLDLIFHKPGSELIAILAMQTLELALSKKDCENISTILYEKHKLMDKFVKQIHFEKSPYSSDYFYAMSNLIRAVMKKLPPAVQESIVKDLLPCMDLTKEYDLYLTSGILGYLDETVSIEDHFESLVERLTKLVMESENENVSNLCQHLLCSLFNRMADDEYHRSVLNKLLISLRKELKKHNKKAICILSWIGKGLLARGHPLAGEIVEDIADLLDHPSLGHIAAFAFEILSAEFPQLHLPLIKNLFKQKLFVLVMKKLEHKLENTAENHLRALVQVYEIAPHLVLKMNINKVGPIVLKCLLLSNDKALETTLKIILHFIKDEDSFFRDHLQTLVPQLLKLSTYDSDMQVRIRALECLHFATKYPPFLLLPYKQEVVLGLQSSLDDHKRLVRNAAVTARLQWFLVGTDSSNATND
ncbi:MMS19 nucleotide excision repair protein isoform X2 [Malaya genurostris]|uniref:MMS19 nucleotide excision repair protein isoform X2 n=1 Tax=Malaya genurostris TaxID=325434 RepID=UPI0026F3F0BB|nr:MMS19 nucleotide excision repair protein isoform X2 [Malaya genurostris]